MERSEVQTCVDLLTTRVNSPLYHGMAVKCAPMCLDLPTRKLQRCPGHLPPSILPFPHTHAAAPMHTCAMAALVSRRTLSLTAAMPICCAIMPIIVPCQAVWCTRVAWSGECGRGRGEVWIDMTVAGDHMKDNSRIWHPP